MKKEIKYYEYFCDKCGGKVDKLYGPEGRNVFIKLKNIPQSQAEEATITVSYYFNQNSGAKVVKGSICKDCFSEILRKALTLVEAN